MGFRSNLIKIRNRKNVSKLVEEELSKQKTLEKIAIGWEQSDERKKIIDDEKAVRLKDKQAAIAEAKYKKKK